MRDGTTLTVSHVLLVIRIISVRITGAAQDKTKLVHFCTLLYCNWNFLFSMIKLPKEMKTFKSLISIIRASMCLQIKSKIFGKQMLILLQTIKCFLIHRGRSNQCFPCQKYIPHLQTTMRQIIDHGGTN